MGEELRGHEIVERVRKACEDFGSGVARKFAGAAAVEILRGELRREGITTSARDVYARGVNFEIDVVVPKTNAKPRLGLLYEPQEVVVALEVKKTGSFGKPCVDKVKHDFEQLSKIGVKCAYLTFEERKTYKWRLIEEPGAFRVFNIAWHVNSGGKLRLEPAEATENWEAFVGFLRKTIAGE
jgi:hypothetical protein